MSETIGFIGTGNMGLPMAANLLDAGFTLAVYNRTADKAAPLVAKGAQPAASPAEVARPGGIVVSMLADDAAVEQLVLGGDGFLDALGRDGIHLCMGTVSPALTRRLAARHTERGGAHVSGPVFGRPDAAAARKLWMTVAGPASARARVHPLLEAMGQAVFDFGDEPAAANVAKLAGNFLIVAAMEAMAESFALVEKNQVDREQFAQMMAETLFACPVYRNYGRAIATRTYEPAGFRLALGHKDVGLVLQSAGESNTPMPFASLLRDRLAAALARGRGDLDWAGLARGVSEDAGLPG